LPESVSFVEERACRIDDPVKRLRYLRHAMSIEVRPANAVLRRRRSRILRIAITLVPILAIAFTPTPTGTAETFVRERGLLIAGTTGQTAAPPVPRIWRVEGSDKIDVYSNGLRVDRTFAVSNRPRVAFPVFPLSGSPRPVRISSTPVGIVFHTTESLLAPFDEEDNGRLRQLGRSLVEVIRREHAYHYLIDRFGRVFAVVNETDAANHAGHSVWGGADGIFVDLNDSFLAVSFEGQSGARDEITPAQITSAKVLTEMLRSRYGIPAENCVTHAQVSVNPDNMRIGSHTDWGGHFPFAAMGLPDNYSIPLASIYAFGFEFDDVFVAVTGGWKGVYLAADQIERQAAAESVTADRYRALLQQRYRQIAAELKAGKQFEEGETP
jgi:hypothetical protein